jgi:hypothetical protein
MAQSNRKFRHIGLNAGLICIEKLCGFCRRRHIVEFPLDDLHVARRMNSFCARCDAELEEALQRNPSLRWRRPAP